MARQYETFKLSDDQLIKSLESTVKTLKAETADFNLSIDEHPQKIICPIEQLIENQDVQSIIKMKASVLGRVIINLGKPYNGCTIDIKRGNTSDRVTISFRNDLPLPNAVQLLNTIQQGLRPYERDESFDKLLGDELAEFYRKREQGLVKLEELAQRIIEKNEEYRKKLDQEAQATQTQLNKKYEVKENELQKEHERKNEDILQREKSLETRLKEIDDRSSRHARRQIRKDLKNEIAKRSEKFTLTITTRQKRIVIHAVFLALIGMLGFVLYFWLSYFAAENLEGVFKWYNIVKISILTAATAAALIYYIRWNDIWFKRHADEEFRTKRFELDVDRASWLVEMALEWKEEKGTEIPKELLERLSANLFDKPSDQEDVRHPSEDLLSALLSASAELNLNIPGVGTLRLDRKGTKKFKRAVEET